ncbi:MAG: tRNA (adenosine(37)-N6)-threonylcarbamoyltransferase complex ATPase subunit type 1 TsaE [Flavobacteriaceae bacterium]|nr:tRNA (adenosine(37)-N6)-threonylcarbamoyltransferase complex ATPase subunit type 1 TsaE [Flavobacteriaceae bacterium]MDZ4147807.1 tRNA (adenosine(37)-N6)-threonylcarbamoyltransferase complex ATPase subunit type 1 TsaE [Flavobacteriaceae bacterium]
MGSESLEVTYKLSELESVSRLILDFCAHKVVLINGEMGAGKTTLIKSLLKTLGCKDNVSSPTFSLVNEYQIDTEKIFHFDFYRINHVEEALDMGFEEYLDQNARVFIEWPDIVLPLIPKSHTEINIETKTDESRKCTIVNSTFF